MVSALPTADSGSNCSPLAANSLLSSHGLLPRSESLLPPAPLEKYRPTVSTVRPSPISISTSTTSFEYQVVGYISPKPVVDSVATLKCRQSTIDKKAMSQWNE